VGRGRKSAAESLGLLYALKVCEVGIGGRLGGGRPYLNDSEGTSRSVFDVVAIDLAGETSRLAQKLHSRVLDFVPFRDRDSIPKGM
jgi:hypothetical protein